jgi:hypothetical protein
MNKKNTQKSKYLFPGKKGLGIGQVFVFIVAAITFSLIMIFGYKSITGFIKSGEDVQFVQFKTSLDTSIKKIYTEYEAFRIEKYSLPGEYEKICFIDLNYPPEKIRDEMLMLCNNDSLACSVWEEVLEPQEEERRELSGYERVDENVFLTPSSPVKIKVHTVSLVKQDEEGEYVAAGFLCVPIQRGGFSLALEGRGDRTELSIPES